MYERKICEVLKKNKLEIITEKEKTFTVLNRENCDYVTENIDIANDNKFKYFKYNSKLLGNVEADGVNETSKNAIFAVPLKGFSNFWISIKMPSINFKVELKT